MANLDFYATVADHEAVVTDLCQQGDVRIFESYSDFDRDLREFTRPVEILDELRQAKYPRQPVLLQLWVPAASAKIEIVRFSVSVKGHSHRHRIAGWGLMQLYLSKETETEIHPSHFGHFNQRGAENRSMPSSSALANPGTAADWDWELLRKISRRFQRRIRAQFAGMKVGGRPVLRDAERLMKDGRRLVN